jgi:hypothetical protein
MDKWYYIGIGLFLVVMAAGMGYETHTQGQCRVEAIKAGKSAEDIVKICK